MNMCDCEEEEITAEQLEAESAEWKARGPFKVEERTRKPYKDFMGNVRELHVLCVVDAAGVEVGYPASQEQSEMWAIQLTQQGVIED
jgi:hypothetical protein